MDSTRLLKQQFDIARKNRMREEYAQLDPRRLANMSDKDLAAWQSGYTPDTAQWMLATFEWQRRLTAKHVRAALLVGAMTVIGAIVGALIMLAGTYWERRSSQIATPQSSMPASSPIKKNPHTAP